MGHLINRAMLYTFSTAMDIAKDSYTEYLQVDGAQNVPDETALWLLKHDSMRDSMNLGSLWKDIPGRPAMRVATRTNHARIGPLNPIYNWLVSPVTFEVHRPFIGEGMSEEERLRMREQNKRTIENVRRSLESGVHAAVFPEGTVMTDGRMKEVKAGCYNLAQARPGGAHVACVPVGLTYDRLTSRGDDGKRDRVYVNVGQPFRYEAVARMAEETDEQYTKRDIKAFTDRVKNTFLHLTTITPAQLAGEYLITAARAGQEHASRGKIAGVVDARVHTLAALDLVIDKELLSEDSRTAINDSLFDALIAEGYITREGRILKERMLAVPTDMDAYRSENKLLHSANRIYELAESRPDIRSALDSTRYF